jgi:hypothetical protein
VRRPPSKPQFDPSVAEIDEEVTPPAQAAAVLPVKPRPKKTAGKNKGRSSRLPKGAWIGLGFGGLVCLVLFGTYYLAEKWQSQEYMPVALTPTGGTAQGSGAARIIVKVSKLLEDYDRDEKEADERYLGNILQVDGTVATMRTGGEDGKIHLDLKEGSKFTMHVAHCEFGFSGQQALGSVQPGDPVTVVGRCDGKHSTVVLKECQLLQAPMRAIGGHKRTVGS